jgi:hypothetical protein
MSLVTLNTVRYYTQADVYHYTVDNRPIQDLASNDLLLQAGLDMLNASIAGGVSDQIFVAGTDFIAGTSTSVTMLTAPPNANSMWVFMDGVYQNQNTYTVSGATVTFNAVIPLGTSTIEIKWSNIGIGSAASTIVQTVTNADFSIPTAKDYVLTYTGTLTATHTVTLPGTASQGYKVRVLRDSTVTQAFNVNVNKPGAVQLKALVTAGTWADFIYTGTAWIQTAAGSL